MENSQGISARFERIGAVWSGGLPRKRSGMGYIDRDHRDARGSYLGALLDKVKFAVALSSIVSMAKKKQAQEKRLRKIKAQILSPSDVAKRLKKKARKD